MSSDFRTANERLNRFASMDSNLGRKLADLSVLESNEVKLSMALESGRIYGLRQQKYNHILQRQLNKMHAPTERMW